MTTELEKQFFSVFGIKPKYQDTCTVEEKYWDNEELANEYGTFDQYMNAKCGNQENCTTQCSCAYQKEIYPQITDRQYLELMCVSNKELIRRFDISGSDLESIKKNILSQCMKNYTFYSNTLCETYNRLGENFKHQVQAIFKGER